MKKKILIIGDSTENSINLQKYSKNFDIKLIDFPRKGVDITTKRTEGIEFFDSLLISKQVEKINKIKNDFDLCLAVPWAGARVAYLAGINYITYFVGNDITSPPFIKNKFNDNDASIKKYNFLERKFYSNVFKKSILCVTSTKLLYNELIKYRNDAYRLDHMFVDTELFNEKIPPINLPKKKFIFFCPQRVSPLKGTQIIWDALKICKSDFEFWQVKWFIEKTTVEDANELTPENKKIMDNAPEKVRFIPLIPKKNLGSYYTFSDAVVGEMYRGIQSAVEREAALCKKPVISFTDKKYPSLINGKEILPPFLPNSRDPKELASLFDKIVNDIEFRNNLAGIQYEYIKKISSPETVAEEWEKIFDMVLMKNFSIERKISIKEKIFRKIFIKLEKKYIKKFEKDNIKVWGEIEYKKRV